MITLKPVDESSFYQVLQLTVREEQRHWVADNATSLAECWLYRDNGDVFPYAVHTDEGVVGFVLIDIDEDDKQFMLWRVMIDQSQQGKGYGKSVLEAVMELAKNHPICDHLRVDYVKGNDKMAHLLSKLDFEVCGEDEREMFTQKTYKRYPSIHRLSSSVRSA
ncbi:GNAT family N-acetyltransferase [Streptococcus caprae]|uniref:GNAT family N-acetyltransferase n=1 Tax=Streptococcus caprae TaxID=1640501 RepID=A0ABV8CVY0_9STRE